ncbi:MAG TPA: GntR family transcriptional regulator [Treponema sp.]|nr:GntR family transcriptional regulator [Treponema sp.]
MADGRNGRNLSAEVYETLSERIRTWLYPPGHRLTEEELCNEFGMSRSPIREALNMLVEAGLVDKAERKGYRVRKIDLQELQDIYDTRLVLELAVIERICERGISSGLLRQLRKRWKELRDALPAMAHEAALEDEHFHEALAAEAGNRVMQRILKEIDRSIHFVRLSDITDPERLRKTCSDHLEILDALEKHDLQRAKELTRENIHWGKEKVANALKEALVRSYGMV